MGKTGVSVRSISSSSEAEPLDVTTVMETLHDVDCRTILSKLQDPRTVRELLERCDIPRSTLYQKLDQLSEVGLIREGIEIGSNGRHASRYLSDFEEIIITRDDEGTLEVEIKRPAKRADERLTKIRGEY